MRSITDVIDSLVAIDGADPDFVERLGSLRSSAVFRSPEQTGDTWAELGVLFNAYIPLGNHKPWQKKAISVFCNTPEEGV